jgi:hypothetical protein
MIHFDMQRPTVLAIAHAVPGPDFDLAFPGHRAYSQPRPLVVQPSRRRAGCEYTVDSRGNLS